MLILSRKPGEAFFITDAIKVTLCSINERRSTIEIAVEASDDVVSHPVHMDEVCAEECHGSITGFTLSVTQSLQVGSAIVMLHDPQRCTKFKAKIGIDAPRDVRIWREELSALTRK